MNRRQKLVQQQFLNNEKGVIKRLDQVYTQALKDIDGNIERLMKRFDPETGDLMQSAVYQLKYQKMIRAQVEGILDKMHTSEYLTVSDYLEGCYEDGFVGSLFDLHGQNVPLAIPLNQEAMVRAVQLDSKISEGLYTHLGEDVNLLKKKITAQVSRSIVTGSSFSDCARQLANQSRIGYNRAVRIARTEGHRIQAQATMDSMDAAVERGADLVKQWDATLDGKTRESHVAVDGEIREKDETFSNGLKFPGDPAGGAAEVVNCRCALLQRARWAVGGSFTKWNNFTKQLETFESPEAYDEFKKGFFSDENKEYMKYVQKMEKKYGTRDLPKILERMNEQEQKRHSELLAGNPMFNKKVPDVVDSVLKEVTNRFGQVITFHENMITNDSWKDTVAIIKKLGNEYDTRLQSVSIGSGRFAGSVSITCATMNLSSKMVPTAVHEFAHTLSSVKGTKYGLLDDEDFWGEVRKVRTAYRKAIRIDRTRSISSYADTGGGSNAGDNADEFMAEAFTHAKLKELGIPIPDTYGKDFTYSNMVLGIVDKYFKKGK